MADFISAVTIDGLNAASPGAQNITVPADATAMLIIFGRWIGTDGANLSSMASTAVGGSFQIEQLGATNTTSLNNVGFALGIITATGAQTLTPVWSSASGEGPTFFVMYVKNVDISSLANLLRDFALDHQGNATNVTGTVDSSTTDLVVVAQQKFNAAPSQIGGTTSRSTHVFNAQGARLATVDSPGAATTTVDGVDEDFSSLVVVSLRNSPGGGGGAAARHMAQHSRRRRAA